MEGPYEDNMHEGVIKVTKRSCLSVAVEARPLFCDTVEALLLPRRSPVLKEEVTVPDHVAIDRVGQLASIQLPLSFPLSPSASVQTSGLRDAGYTWHCLPASPDR